MAEEAGGVDRFLGHRVVAAPGVSRNLRVAEGADSDPSPTDLVAAAVAADLLDLERGRAA